MALTARLPSGSQCPIEHRRAARGPAVSRFAQRAHRRRPPIVRRLDASLRIASFGSAAGSRSAANDCSTAASEHATSWRSGRRRCVQHVCAKLASAVTIALHLQRCKVLVRLKRRKHSAAALLAANHHDRDPAQ